MDKYPLIRKSLAVGIILLFIGVAITPSINFNVVKASPDNDFVEVTTQACGIKGFGNTTIKLTRQQYQNLKEYLVEFRSRLNQTTTRGEAVPLFKEAVVELDKYGLLPKGMNVAQTQRLVLGGYKNAVIDRLAHKYTDTVYLNLLCLITGTVYIDVIIGLLGGLGELMLFIGRFGGGLVNKIGYFLCNLDYKISSISPVLLYYNIRPSEGNITTIGLLGIKKTEIRYEYIDGFTGIKITRPDSGETFLLGFALIVQ